MKTPVWFLEGFRPNGPGRIRCPKCGTTISSNALARASHQRACPATRKKDAMFGPNEVLQYSHEVLTAVFGSAYTKLANEAKHCLQEDVQGVRDELMDEDDSVTLREAAQVLRQRIGGAKNLKIYADCLVAQKTRGL